MKNVCSNSRMGWCNFKFKIPRILEHHPRMLTQNVISLKSLKKNFPDLQVDTTSLL